MPLNFLNMKKLLVVVIALFSIVSFGQRGFKDSNRIGIGGGLTQMNIYTSNFTIKPQQGWMAGMHVRGNYYNDWQMSFGMFFTDSNFSLETYKGLSKVDTNFKLSAVQIYLLPGYVISENHFNIEFGPVLQINDKLKISKDDENNVLVDYATNNVKAKDITQVSKINANVYAGINVGITNVRLRLGYQYGINNFFGNYKRVDELKTNIPNEKFKGNLGILSGQLTIYL